MKILEAVHYQSVPRGVTLESMKALRQSKTFSSQTRIEELLGEGS